MLWCSRFSLMHLLWSSFSFVAWLACPYSLPLSVRCVLHSWSIVDIFFIIITPSSNLVAALQMCIAMHFLFMFLTSLCSPGYLKLNMESEDSQNLLSEEQRQKQLSGAVCSDCCSRRPLRTHHCSQCYRCIIRYDHHSYFLNNCIGYDNQVYYFFFLLFWILQNYITCFSVVRYFHFPSLNINEPSFFLYVYCILCVVVIPAVVWFVASRYGVVDRFL